MQKFVLPPNRLKHRDKKLQLHEPSENTEKLLTSRHHMTHILHRQGGVLVLCVDPDDPVTQTRHGEHGPGGERSSGNPRSVYTEEFISERSERLPLRLGQDAQDALQQIMLNY